MGNYTVGSFFAGVGGFDKSFEDVGYEVKWAVEWEKNCQHVLRKQFPNTKLYGDITAVKASDLEPVDVITWGFPCQDVSHAGKRKGMVNHDGSLTRSGLFYIALDLIIELNPRVHIFENVIGLISSGRAGFKGEDFEGCLEALDKSGFDCTWITMDSRFFGLAQRRRRVFGLCTRKTEPGVAEGYIREIFSQSKGVFGNPPKSPKKGKKASAHAGDGVEGESGLGGDASDLGDAIQLDFDFDGGRSLDIGGDAGGSGGGLGGDGGRGGGLNGFRMVAFGEYADDETASALKRRDYKDATDLVTDGASAVDCRNLNLFDDVSGTLQSKKSGGYSLNYQNPVLVPGEERTALAVDAHHDKLGGEISNTLLHHKAGGMSLMAVNPVLVSHEKIEVSRESGIGYYMKDDVASPIRSRGDDHGSTLVTLTEKECYPIDIRNATRTTEKSEMNRQGMGVGKDGDPSPTLTNVFVPAVAIEDAP